MNTQTKVIIGGLVLALVMSGAVFFKGGNTGPAGQDGKSYGSVTGPDLQFQDMTFNGVPYRFVRTGFYTASSTLCSIKSPSVDSRLEHLSTFFSSVPSYATQYMIGFGTQNATTTSLVAVTQIAFGAISGGIASSTIASSTSSLLIPANSYVNLNYSTSTGANVAGSGYAPVGRCEAVFVGV